MQGVIRNSKSLGVELGMLFCQDEKGKITPSMVCMGDECSIEKLHDCKDKAEIGSFHTHPGSLKVSGEDIDFTLSYGHKFLCIGDWNGERIKCYDLSDLPWDKRKKIHREAQELKLLQQIVELTQRRHAEYREKFEEFNKKLDKSANICEL